MGLEVFNDYECLGQINMFEVDSIETENTMPTDRQTDRQTDRHKTVQ